MKAEQPLVIRADANTRMGTGHVMRCIALAQAWQDQGGTVTFITACDSPGLLNRLQAEEFAVVELAEAYPHPSDWETTQNILSQQPGAWVVLDGYHFEAAYQLKIKAAGHPLLMLDDVAHLDSYHADILLNQNINASQLAYRCDPHTRLLLGTQYILLRREFWPWRGWQREIPTIARKVLVTLGGGDPDNQTLKVIRALQQLKVDNLKVMVVIGGSNPHLNTLETAIRHSPFAIQLVQNVTNMPELMAWADVAVSAGGSTCWELAFMGLPTIILVIADNQREIATGLDQVGMAVNLGWFETVTAANLAKNLRLLLNDPEKWQQMSHNGKHLVDGDGPIRTIHAMQDTPLIHLRPVTREDCKLIYEWANDPVVRQNAFSSDPIPWESHVRWFQGKLSNPNCVQYIAVDEHGNKVGQIRFDVECNRAVVDVSIDTRYRGLGYGSQLIKRGTKSLLEDRSIKTVEALVKKENILSVRSFEKAGFQNKGIQTVESFDCFYLVW